MKKDSKYNYEKAEGDLYDMGTGYPEEVYDYRSEKAFRSYMKEHDLNPDKYAKNGKGKYGSGGSGKGGCYLTTACVVSRGLPDDCDELQTLRSFRDGYLAARANGQAEIGQYYEMAPGIAAAIGRREDSAEIWERVYTELVVPCTGMIRAGENESAYQLYKAYSMELYSEYLS